MDLGCDLAVSVDLPNPCMNNTGTELTDCRAISSESVNNLAVCMDNDDSKLKDCQAVLSEMNPEIYIDNENLELRESQAVSSELESTSEIAVSSENIPGICIENHNLEPTDQEICSDIELVSEIRIDNGDKELEQSNGQENDPALRIGGDESESSDSQGGRGKGDYGRVHLGFQCNVCSGNIVGFRYTCVQCLDWDSCSSCEAAGHHPTHYVLRVPEPRPFGEVQWVVERIRSELARGLVPRPRLEDRLLDSVKTEVMEVDLREDEEEGLGGEGKKEVELMLGACVTCARAAAVLDNVSKLQDRQVMSNNEQFTAETYNTATNVERASTAEKNIQCSLPIPVRTETTDINKKLVFSLVTPPGSDRESETHYIDDTLLSQIAGAPPTECIVDIFRKSDSNGVSQKRLGEETNCDIEEKTRPNNTVSQKHSVILSNVDVFSEPHNIISGFDDTNGVLQSRLGTETNCNIVQATTGSNCDILQEATVSNYDILTETKTSNSVIVQETIESDCDIVQETMWSSGEILQGTTESNSEVLKGTTKYNCDIVQDATLFNCDMLAESTESNSDILQETTVSNFNILQEAAGSNNVSLQNNEITIILPDISKRKVDMPRKSGDIMLYYDVTGGVLQKKLGVVTDCNIIQETTESNGNIVYEINVSNCDIIQETAESNYEIVQETAGTSCEVAEETTEYNSNTLQETMVSKCDIAQETTVSNHDIILQEATGSNVTVPQLGLQNNEIPIILPDIPKKKVNIPRKSGNITPFYDVTGGVLQKKLEVMKPNCKIRQETTGHTYSNTLQEAKKSNNFVSQKRIQDTEITIIETDTQKRNIDITSPSNNLTPAFDVTDGIPLARLSKGTDCDIPQQKNRFSTIPNTETPVLVPEVKRKVVKSRKLPKNTLSGDEMDGIPLARLCRETKCDIPRETKRSSNIHNTEILDFVPEKKRKLGRPRKSLNKTLSNTVIDDLPHSRVNVQIDGDVSQETNRSNNKQNIVTETPKRKVGRPRKLHENTSSVDVIDGLPFASLKVQNDCDISQETNRSVNKHNIETETPKKKVGRPRKLHENTSSVDVIDGLPFDRLKVQTDCNISQETKRSSNKQSIETETQKRKVGRPRKLHENTSSVDVIDGLPYARLKLQTDCDISQETNRSHNKNNIETETPKRKVGRPRKLHENTFSLNVVDDLTFPRLKEHTDCDISSQQRKRSKSIQNTKMKGSLLNNSDNNTSRFDVTAGVPLKRFRAETDCGTCRETTTSRNSVKEVANKISTDPGVSIQKILTTESPSTAPLKRLQRTKSTHRPLKRQISGLTTDVPQNNIQNTESSSIVSQKRIKNTGSNFQSQKRIENISFSRAVLQKKIRNTEYNSVVSHKRLKRTKSTSILPQNSIQTTESPSVVPKNTVMNTGSHSVVSEKRIRKPKSFGVRSQDWIQDTEFVSNVPKKRTPKTKSTNVVQQTTIQNTELHTVVPQNNSTQNTGSSSVVPQKRVRKTKCISVGSQDRIPENESISDVSVKRTPKMKSNIVSQNTVENKSHSVIPQKRERNTKSISFGSQNWIPDTESISEIPMKKTPKTKKIIQEVDSFVSQEKTRKTESISVVSQDRIPDTKSITDAPTKKKTKPSSIISQNIIQNTASRSVVPHKRVRKTKFVRDVPQKMIRDIKSISVGSQNLILDSESINDVSKKKKPKTKCTSIVLPKTILKIGSRSVVPQKRIRNTESISVVPHNRIPTSSTLVTQNIISHSVILKNIVQNTDSHSVTPQNDIQITESHSVTPQNDIQIIESHRATHKNDIQNTESQSVIPQNIVQNSESHSVTPQNDIQNTESHNVTP